MASIQPKQYKGHTFFEGADRVNPFRDGYFFYMVAYQWQNGPHNPGGSASTHGLVVPKDRTQYGQLVNDVLNFVRENGMGAPGYQVVQFFDIKAHTEYRDPYAVAEERQQANSERADKTERPALP